MKWIKKSGYSTKNPFLPKVCAVGKFTCDCDHATLTCNDLKLRKSV